MLVFEKKFCIPITPMKLYHYEHCPFCQRVRLFMGFKNIPYEKIIVSYADKQTPKDLCNSSTLPIFDFGDGMVINESIDIMREIEMRHPNPIGFIGPVEAKLQWASMAVVSLPRYFDILLPAFADFYSAEWEKFPEGKEHFIASKEKKRGKIFAEIKKETPEIFTNNILPALEEIVDIVEDEYFLMGPTFSVADCVLAADLSALRTVENITLPQEIISYIERVEKKCRVSLLENLGE